MKLLPGYTEIEPTEEIRAKVHDKRLLEGNNLMVQEMRFGKSGCIRLIGNKNPDPIRRQKLMDEIGSILYEGALRYEMKDKKEKEKSE